MNSAITTKKEKFMILLQQLGLDNSEYLDYFHEAEIDKLIVEKEQRTWHFHLKLEKAVPYHVWHAFILKMEMVFVEISTIVINVKIAKQENDEMVFQYWKPIIQELQAPPHIFESLALQSLFFEKNQMILTFFSEAEARQIKQNYLPRILQAYEKFGFESLQFEIKVDYESKNRLIADFQEEMQKKDQENALQSLQSINQLGKKTQNNLSSEKVQIGKAIKVKDIIPIEEIIDEEKRIAIQGCIFEVDIRTLKSGRLLLQAKITDYTDSLMLKMFSRDRNDEKAFQALHRGMWIYAQGAVQMDTFNRVNPELLMMVQDINRFVPAERQDTAPADEKRVELHLHTQMSQMDAITPIGNFVAQAKKWGHRAIAITDHGSVQAFPDAYAAGKKHDLKIIYGVEVYLVDDGVCLVENAQSRVLQETNFVVFDVETTGLSAIYDTIIELAAVKIYDGEIIDRFSEFANPHHPLSSKTIELTNITDDMVANAPEIADVLTRFREWAGDAVLVAHNASFDIGFINVGYQKLGYEKVANPIIDTLELARTLYPEFKTYGLGTLAKKLNVELVSHHRAIYDAEATGNILMMMIKEMQSRGITNITQMSQLTSENGFQRTRPTHCTILVQNATGLKNLFKLISISHIQYFYRVPRIPRSVLIEHREGLLIGSGCAEGEVFEAITQKPLEDVVKLASFYDYIEVHPKEVYAPLIEAGRVNSEKSLEMIISNLIELGERIGKPVVATGNTHYVDEHEKIYRKILIASQGGGNPMNRYPHPDVHFRTTDEMLASFSFLEETKAKEIVITNPNMIADLIEVVKPIKDELYTPRIDGADEEIRQMTYHRAHTLYGENLPEIVLARIEKELESIIGHGFSVIYLISHKLVKKSVDDGYLVGSRGSVGSSLVAYLTGITEVNPLPPHYVCPTCTHSQFFDDGRYGSGYDLPDAICRQCDSSYRKDGQEIPFETFLGYKGDKVPDIDLNFSGQYQATAHAYTKELFGEDNVYRAGTIATVADKTAYGFVKGYLAEHNIHKKSTEIDRLAKGCTGTKRTTGQHPGGIIVIPDYMDIYDFSPIQYPADNSGSDWKTTHFDFHSIHDNVLKLDILGHDDPTAIKMLQDLSGIDPMDIPTDDPAVMKIFSSTEPLGVTEEAINSKTGTFGIPEFGTQFVRQMLEATKPSTFAELVQISGLSHGTDVWLGNAQELINHEICTLKEVIGCRDDIMVYLIHQGLEPAYAFKIMESVRKGKGLTTEMEEEMLLHHVQPWYIDSCKKIKYMFPKAHACAYVLMSVRIAYFKVHYPLYFYAMYFSVRTNDYEIETMVRGASSLRARLKEIADKGKEATAKEEALVTTLELALEMCERGFSFKKIDLYRSAATEFIIDGDGLIPPFVTIPGLGESVAEQIVKARAEGEFLSKEDLQKRGRVSKTIIEFMTNHGCLENLPEENQLSFF